MSGEVLYHCPNGCGRIYRNYGSVRKHLNYRCGVAPKFKCEFCDKAFHHRHHLKYHQTKRNQCTIRRQIVSDKFAVKEDNCQRN